MNLKIADSTIANEVMSYVINLERRSDRINKFLSDYAYYGPKVPVSTIQAIDGSRSISEQLLSSEKEYLNFFSEENDYDDNPRIMGCTLSHMRAWSKIANGPYAYGIIFEDDAQFREDGLFRRSFNDYHKHLGLLLKKFPKSIVYLGAGDILPIHVSVPSDSLLRAQEKSHVSEIIFKYFGLSKKSIFVFDWMGAFTYILSKEAA